MTIARSPEMLAMAERVVWSCPPEEALQNPYLFMAHLMTYGTIKDVVYVQKTLGLEAFRETLERAPPAGSSTSARGLTGT